MADYDMRIDWRGSGTFSQAGDVVNADLRPGVSTESGRDQSRALSPTAVGSMSFELNNLNRVYSPENGSSPIAGFVNPARDLWIDAVWQGRRYNLFRGYLDEYKVDPHPNVKRVNATALDALSLLKEVKVSTPLYPSIRTGEAIHAVLDSIGWPYNRRDIDLGATTLRWWFAEGQDAWTVINDLVKAEGPPALLTSSALGSISFRDRHHRLWTTLNNNPTFNAGTAYWNAFGGTAAVDYSQYMRDRTSLKFTPDGVTAIAGVAADRVLVGAGGQYTATAWMRCTQARTLSLNVNWYSSTGSYLSTSSLGIAVAANTWTYFLAEYTAPVGAFFGAIVPTMTGTPPASAVMYVDEARLMLPWSVPRATWRDKGTEPCFSAPVEYDQGWRDVYNSISMSVDERKQAPFASVVWESETTYRVSAGTTMTIEVETSDPFYDAISPVPGEDFRVRSGSMTAGLSRTSGRTTEIYINAVSDCVIDRLQLRAFPVTVARTYKIEREDAASIAMYGRKGWPDEDGGATIEDVRAITGLILMQRAQRLPIFKVVMIGSNDARMAECMERNLSDRVTIIEGEVGINRDFFIEQIRHDVPHGGLYHTTTFGLEAAPTGTVTDVFTFDHPSLGRFGTGKFAH